MPGYLKQMYKDNISDLSANEKEKFKQVLIDYQDVFSRDEWNIKSKLMMKFQSRKNLDELHYNFKSKSKNILRNF